MTVEGAGLRAQGAGRAARGPPCAWAERDQNTELEPGGQSQLPKELEGNPARKSDPYPPSLSEKSEAKQFCRLPSSPPTHAHRGKRKNPRLGTPWLFLLGSREA